MLTMMLGGLFSSLLARGPEGGGSGSGPGISAGVTVAKLVEASSLRISLLDPGRSMIQVEVDCDPSSVLRIAARETSRYPVTVVRILLKDRPCYRVMVGDFPDARTALESISLLPDTLNLAGNKPRVIVLGTLGLEVSNSRGASSAARPVASPDAAVNGRPRPAPSSFPAPPPSSVVNTNPEVAKATPTPTVVEAVPAIARVLVAPASGPTPGPATPPAVAVPRITPIVSEALPVVLPTPEPVEQSRIVSVPPKKREPVAGKPDSAVVKETPVRGPEVTPTGKAGAPVGRTEPDPNRVASLQDFARNFSLRKEGKKGTLSTMESGPGSGNSNRSQAGVRSEPRISTITQDGPDREGMVWISGLVKNSGTGAACTIGVAVTLLGSDNHIVGTGRTVAVQERLNPGESTPFRAGIVVPGQMPAGGNSPKVSTRPRAEVTTFTECP